MRTSIAIASGLILVLALCWRLAERARVATPADETRLAAPEESAPVPAPATVSAPAIRAVREPATAEPLDEELRRRAAEEIALRWAEVRAEPPPAELATRGLQTFADTPTRSPRAMGRTLGEERRRDELERTTLDSDDPMALLDLLGARELGPQPGIVGDAVRFERLFPRRVGAALPGALNLNDAGAALSAGCTVVFPAGVFGPRRLVMREAFPRDVTVLGRGMDATLLVLGDLATNALVNLCLQDCTIFTDNRSLFDLRRRPASLRLERVRVIGFDSGAGGSSLFHASGLALLARASRFEGGYGRVSDGTLFDVRSDALLARFESCWIDQVELRFGHLRPGASVAFVNCTITNVMDRQEAIPAGVSMPGTTVQHFEWNAEGVKGPPVKDLNELFPNWRERLVQ